MPQALKPKSLIRISLSHLSHFTSNGDSRRQSPLLRRNQETVQIGKSGYFCERRNENLLPTDMSRDSFTIDIILSNRCFLPSHWALTVYAHPDKAYHKANCGRATRRCDVELQCYSCYIKWIVWSGPFSFFNRAHVARFSLGIRHITCHSRRRHGAARRQQALIYRFRAELFKDPSVLEVEGAWTFPKLFRRVKQNTIVVLRNVRREVFVIKASF